MTILDLPVQPVWAGSPSMIEVTFVDIDAPLTRHPLLRVNLVSGADPTVVLRNPGARADTEKELSLLASEWKRTRQKTSSSILKMVTHPAYQRIIGKGERAIPFLLHEIQREPDHWFWALTAITGEDPVPDEDRGELPAMTRSWVEWGRKRGYL